MTVRHLLKLPVELIAGVLGSLEYKDLLKCSEVCKTLRHIVHSSRLQYTIDLGLHRMLSLDHSGKALPFHTRRKLLRECESNWRHFRWRQKHTLDLFALGSIYELTGGFYGNAMPPFVTLVELPSATTDSALDTPGRSWFFSMPDIAVVDFTMDPAQDLLVLLAYAPSESEQVYELYFKTMSTGQDHPRADVPSIRSFNKTPSTGVNPSDVNSAVRVQVAGELVALLIKDASESLGGHLEIWNYTRSELSCFLSSNAGIDDFSFLSEDTFILVTPTGLIELWHFQDPSIASLIPFPKARYALPTLGDGYTYWYLSMSANPTTGHVPTSDRLSSNKPLFHPCPDERVHAFCVYIVNDNQVDAPTRSYVFFVNVHTFLHPSPPILDFMASRSDAPPIPWSLWGPENTRWFPDCTHGDWQHSLYGYRTIEIVPLTPPQGAANAAPDPNRAPYLLIRDFNPHALARAEAGEHDEDGWQGRVVRNPSIISARDAFAEDVVSHLSYLEITSTETFDVTDVMMDGSRILLLKRDDEGQLTGIKVMTL